MNFASIGISPVPLKLLNAFVQFKSGSTTKAGEISSYEFSFKPQNDLPKNINFRVVFPIDYDLSTSGIDLTKDCYPIETAGA